MEIPLPEFVALSHVLIVSDGEMLTIELGGRSYVVPRSEVAPVIRVRPPGQSGTLIVRTEFARRVGLVA